MTLLPRLFVSGLTIAAALVDPCGHAQLIAKPPSDVPQVEVVSVTPVALLRIRVIVRNPTAEAVVVPYCDESSRASIKSLCTLAVTLETNTDGVWHAARTRPGVVVGGLPLTKAVTILPGREETFDGQFSRDVFEIPDGVRMRLSLSTWRGEQDLHAEPTGRIVTPSFTAPDARR